METFESSIYFAVYAFTLKVVCICLEQLTINVELFHKSDLVKSSGPIFY